MNQSVCPSLPRRPTEAMLWANFEIRRMLSRLTGLASTKARIWRFLRLFALTPSPLAAPTGPLPSYFSMNKTELFIAMCAVAEVLHVRCFQAEVAFFCSFCSLKVRRSLLCWCLWVTVHDHLCRGSSYPSPCLPRAFARNRHPRSYPCCQSPKKRFIGVLFFPEEEATYAVSVDA